MKTWWNILICMWIYFIHGAVNVNGKIMLTSSPSTATDGELFILICSSIGQSAVNIEWLQNNKSEIITQFVSNCVYNNLSDVSDIISRINVSCNDTIHRIAFRFNSTTDQGAAWQCGQRMDGHTYPISNIYTIEVAPPVMSTHSSLTTTRYIETTSDPATATPKKAPRDDSDSEHLYIVVGPVGGAALLTVVVVGIVCFSRRRKAARQQNYMGDDGNATAGQVYQNTTSFSTMENDLYKGSRDVPPTNTAANQEDDFMLSVSDIYAAVQKPKKRKQDDPMVSEDFNTGDVYAKPNKGLKAQK